jgi:four helix bundle protein
MKRIGPVRRQFGTDRNPYTSIVCLMGDYRRLTVWKNAHELALVLYRTTDSYPDRERYALVAQLRRAAVSIVSNIAEGASRHSDRELARFLRIAYGSSREVECQLLLSRDLGFLNSETWASLDTKCRELGKMLNGLLRSLSTGHRITPPNHHADD